MDASLRASVASATSLSTSSFAASGVSAIAAAANRSGGVHAHSRRPDAPEAAAARACELVAAFATHAAAVGLG